MDIFFKKQNNIFRNKYNSTKYIVVVHQCDEQLIICQTINIYLFYQAVVAIKINNLFIFSVALFRLVLYLKNIFLLKICILYCIVKYCSFLTLFHSTYCVLLSSILALYQLNSILTKCLTSVTCSVRYSSVWQCVDTHFSKSICKLLKILLLQFIK